MTNAVKFILGLIICSVVLGVVSIFIPKDKQSTDSGIYDYVLSTDIGLIKFNEEEFKTKVVNFVMPDYKLFKESRTQSMALNAIWDIRSELPENSVLSEPDILLSYDSIGNSKILFRVNDFTVLQNYFQDNASYSNIEGHENTYYSQSAKGIFTFNEKVLRFSDGEDFPPFEKTTQPKTPIQKSLDYIKEKKSIYTVLAPRAEGKYSNRNVTLNNQVIQVESSQFDAKNPSKDASFTWVENKPSSNIVELRGNFKEDSYVQEYVMDILDKISKNILLDSDSLLGYWDGGIQLEIKSIDSITNEYISFEYNENFEKVEVKKQEDEVFVNFFLLIEDKDQALFDYLVNNNTILISSGDFTIPGAPFPLYVKKNKTGFSISSTRRAASELNDNKQLLNLSLNNYSAFLSAMEILKWNTLYGHGNLNKSFESVQMQGNMTNDLPQYICRIPYNKENFTALWIETMSLTGF